MLGRLSKADQAVGLLCFDFSANTINTTNGDDSAVHVHLAVAKFVEPAPAEKRFTSGGFCRNSQVVTTLAGLHRAFAEVRVNQLPRLSLIIR